MEEKVIYLDKVKEKSFKEKMIGILRKGKNFCIEHKEGMLVIIPVVVSGSIEIIKIIAKRGNLREERRLKEDFVYDAKNRHYYELNRSPRNSDWISIDERMSNGELLGHVLRDMGFID